MVSLLDPLKYKMIIQAVKIISVDNPSTGMKLGHSLIAISQMYMYDSLMLEADTDSKRACYKKAKEFKLVMQSNWSVDVVTGAKRQLHSSTKNDVTPQPTPADVKIMNDS